MEQRQAHMNDCRLQFTDIWRRAWDLNFKWVGFQSLQSAFIWCAVKKLMANPFLSLSCNHISTQWNEDEAATAICRGFERLFNEHTAPKNDEFQIKSNLLKKLAW